MANTQYIRLTPDQLGSIAEYFNTIGRGLNLHMLNANLADKTDKAEIETADNTVDYVAEQVEITNDLLVFFGHAARL